MTRKDYIKRFTEIYKNIPESNKKKASELIGRLADNQMILDECNEHLTAEGAVTEMSQGAYSITRENPWSKVFDSKTKNMLAIIGQLDKMLPDAKAEGLSKAGEALASFVAKGK